MMKLKTFLIAPLVYYIPFISDISCNLMVANIRAVFSTEKHNLRQSKQQLTATNF